MTQRMKAYVAVRRAVLRGRIGRGRLMSERELNEKVLHDSGLGQRSIREALAVLAAQGLVEQRPLKSFRVRDVEASEMAKLLGFQRDIEIPIVDSLAHGQPRLGRATTLCEKMEVALVGSWFHDFLDQMGDFHVGLAEAGHYSASARVLRSHRDKFHLFFGKRYGQKQALAALDRCRTLLQALEAQNGSVAVESLKDLIALEISQVENVK